jgi:hypothetical protein
MRQRYHCRILADPDVDLLGMKATRWPLRGGSAHVAHLFIWSYITLVIKLGTLNRTMNIPLSFITTGLAMYIRELKDKNFSPANLHPASRSRLYVLGVCICKREVLSQIAGYWWLTY